MTSNKQLPPWEMALEKFLLKYKDRKEVIGALVTGSYALGTHNNQSDIDVHIVLSNKSRWRERGNCVVNGFLIEYFINPLPQLTVYRKEDRESFSRTLNRMFALGRVIFDTTGVLAKFQKASRSKLKLGFRKLSHPEIEFGKYALWDGLDDSKALWDQKSDFYPLSHNVLLNQCLDLYRKFLGVEVGAVAKLERYFLNPTFRERYAIKEFSDRIFVALFLSAVRNQSFESLNRLIGHVFKKMGGFKIDGWRFRSKAT